MRPKPHLFPVLPNSGGSLFTAWPITFVVASLICFRCWEFWSLGGLENLYDLLQISESPNLPVAKAIIKSYPHLHSCAKRGRRASIQHAFDGASGWVVR